MNYGPGRWSWQSIFTNYLRGLRRYQLSNHLGNVEAVITDKKIAVASDTNSSLIAYYKPDNNAAEDYYPFGWTMPGRTWEAQKLYRYGFNGKEYDNEVKGKWGQQDYGMRIYDPRVGRFLSVDPITKEYPELTPYQFASNRPIDGVDQDGLEWELSTVNNRLKQQAARLQIARNNNGTISAYDPNQRSWTQKWRDSKNPLANVTYDIANGLHTLPQQLTASVRYEDYITNIGGNVHRAHGIGDEKQRLKNFVNGATALVPGSAASKAEGLIAKYTDDVLTKIENQVTQQVTERGKLFTELSQLGVKYTPDNIMQIGRNASGKIVFLETGSAKSGFQHIMSHADEFVDVGIAKGDISKVVFEAATQGKQVGMLGTRPVYQILYKGEAKNIAVTIGDNGYIVGANPTTKIK